MIKGEAYMDGNYKTWKSRCPFNDGDKCKAIGAQLF